MLKRTVQSWLALIACLGCGTGEGDPLDVDAADLADAAADAGATADAATPLPFSRGSRYCELLIGRIHGADVRAEVWGTQGLSDCPDAQWTALDADAIQAELGADLVVKNGPRVWLVDGGESFAPPGPVERFGGLQMRRLAVVTVPAASAAGPYQERVVERDTRFEFAAGQVMHELIGPDGSVYVMQSYAQIVEPLTAADLLDLAPRLALPEGWRYASRTLDERLTVRAYGRAVVVQDPLQNTYQLRSRERLLQWDEIARVDRDTLAQLVPGATVENGYTVYQARVRTDGRETFATITVPDVAPEAGFHVVVNAHGTTGGDDPCALVGSDWAIGNAGLFGARGLIGVAPEYPGLGTDGVHPYLVAESEAKAVLDSVRVIFEAGVAPLSGGVVLTGFSQGGHAALAAATLAPTYAAELDIRGVAVAAPASVWVEHWSAGLQVDGPHLAYHGLLAWSWAAYYGVEAPLWAPDFEPPFGDRCVFGPDGRDTLDDAVPDEARAIFDPAFLAAWRAADFSAYPRFGEAFAQNRLGPLPAATSAIVYQGDADAVVLEADTAGLVGVLRANGAAVDYEVVPGAGHSEVAFGVLAFPQQRTEAALAWIRAALTRP